MKLGLSQALRAAGERAFWAVLVVGALGLVAGAALVAPLLPAALAGALAVLVTMACAAAVALRHRVTSRRRERSRLDIGSYVLRQTQAGRRVAIYDPATALYHRWYFELRVGEEIGRCRRYGLSMAIIVVTAAARRGANTEASRVQLAQTVNHMVRSVDIAASLDEFEYGICLPHAEAGGAGTTLARLTSELSEHHVTLGLALYPDHGLEGEALIEHARAQIRGGGTPPLQLRTLGALPRPSYSQLARLARDDPPCELKVEAGESIKKIKAGLRRASRRAGISLDVWDKDGAIFFKRAAPARARTAA